MTRINRERLHAEIEGDFVVFLIGARINRWRAVREWLPVLRAMPRMLRELRERPSSGLLGARSSFGLRNFSSVQYWRSFEDLQSYARDREGEHYPAWMRFNRAAKESDAVGIWHETYLVRAGEYETVYNDMPAYGLGEVGDLVPAAGSRRSAAGRLGRTDGTDVAADESGVTPVDDTGDGEPSPS